MSLRIDVCGECGRLQSRCDCPKSVQTAAVDTRLQDQARLLQQHIDTDDAGLAFLAGIRFAQGYTEYGNSLFRMSQQDLTWERDCESADRIVYQAELNRRATKGGVE